MEMVRSAESVNIHFIDYGSHVGKMGRVGLAPRSYVDIQITDHQNVDIQITDHQNVDIQIENTKMSTLYISLH
jgi:hypothetical protein